MRKFIFIVLSLFILSPPCFAEGYEIDGNDLFNETVKTVTDGTFTLNPITLINNFFESFFYEAKNTKALLKTILLVALAAGMVRILSGAFEGSQAAEAAGIACFLLLSLSSVRIFSEVAGYAADTIHNICDFITKFEPIFMTMLLSSGAVTQAAAFAPVLAASVYVLGVLVDKCILPICYFSAVLGICGNIGNRIEIGTLTKLLNSVSKWLLTGVLTLFTAILSLYGFSTKAFNSVAAKGLKFAVGSLVPVVGGILSDTVDTVLTGANLLKSAVGTAGAIALFAIAFTPVIKILVMMLLLKAVAAIVEPFSEKRVVNMLLCVSDTVKIMFSMVVTSALLFIISIAIILLSSGVSF
ncbi:MAG: stage III sporulation protein AE [Clostridia bacterium]|nr:stage III sporulation protein AE [Clostridia bacterium]